MPKTALEVLTAMLSEQGSTKKPGSVVEALGMLSESFDGEGIADKISEWVEEHQDAILADDSVTGSKILDLTITEADIANGAVTDDKLSPSGVLSKANRLMGNVYKEKYGPAAIVDTYDNKIVPPLAISIVPEGETASDPTIVISSRNLVGQSTSIDAPSGLTVNDNGDGTFLFDGVIEVGESVTITFAPEDSTLGLPNGNYVFAADGLSDKAEERIMVSYDQNHDGEHYSYQSAIDRVEVFYDSADGPVSLAVSINNAITGNVSHERIVFSNDVLNVALWHMAIEEDSYRRPSDYNALAHHARWSETLDLQGLGPLFSTTNGIADSIEIDFDGTVSLVRRVGMRGGAAYALDEPETYSIGSIELPALPDIEASVYVESVGQCLVSVDCEKDVTIAVMDLGAKAGSLSDAMAMSVFATDTTAGDILEWANVSYEMCDYPTTFSNYIDYPNAYLAWYANETGVLHIARPYLTAQGGGFVVHADSGKESSIVGVMDGESEWEVIEGDDAQSGPFLLATNQNVQAALQTIGFDSVLCESPSDFIQYSGVPGAYLVWFDKGFTTLYAEHPYLSANLSDGVVEVCASAGGQSFIYGSVISVNWVIS